MMIEDNIENATEEKKIKNSSLISELMSEKINFCKSKSVKEIFTPLERKCNEIPACQISTNTFNQF